MDIIELGKKLIALMEKGEGGEKETAQSKFESLCAKYNLKETDFYAEDKIRFFEHTLFDPSNIYEKKLFSQIVYAVTGSNNHTYKKNDNENVMICECTEAQNVEITITHDYYSKLFENELSLFYIAFLHKHDIFGTPDENNKKVPSLSDGEVLRMKMMQYNMLDGNPQKSLELKNKE